MASRRSAKATAISVADAASWYFALALVAVVVVSALREGPAMAELAVVNEDAAGGGGGRLVVRPCDEMYVVWEGETLHTISDKCGDPFILERNPHIHDPDDVFPGLIIKITPSTNPK